MKARTRFHVKPRDQQGTRSDLVHYSSPECVLIDQRSWRVSRACPSTRCVGEAEWPLQIPEAIGVELVCQASLADTGTSGAFDTFPHLPGRESSLVRPPTIRAGGAENGGRHRPPVTRHAVRWLAPGYGAGAVIHERVPSETDLLGRRLLAWSTPTPGMAVPYGNRWVSG